MVIDYGTVFLMGFSVGIAAGLVFAYIIDRVFDIYGTSASDLEKIAQSLERIVRSSKTSNDNPE